MTNKDLKLKDNVVTVIANSVAHTIPSNMEGEDRVIYNTGASFGFLMPNIASNKYKLISIGKRECQILDENNVVHYINLSVMNNLLCSLNIDGLNIKNSLIREDKANIIDYNDAIMKAKEYEDDKLRRANIRKMLTKKNIGKIFELDYTSKYKNHKYVKNKTVCFVGIFYKANINLRYYASADILTTKNVYTKHDRIFVFYDINDNNYIIEPTDSIFYDVKMNKTHFKPSGMCELDDEIGILNNLVFSRSSMYNSNIFFESLDSVKNSSIDIVYIPSNSNLDKNFLYGYNTRISCNQIYRNKENGDLFISGLKVGYHEYESRVIKISHDENYVFQDESFIPKHSFDKTLYEKIYDISLSQTSDIIYAIPSVFRKVLDDMGIEYTYITTRRNFQ